MSNEKHPLKCTNEACSTLHLSNFSIGVQYGDEIPIRPCSCECHLKEDNIHGEAARKRHKYKEKITND